MKTIDSTALAARAEPRGAQRRAVVIGASLAGLLAARALADRFDEVLLLERDGLPDDDSQRRATPHTQHAHGLLARGKQAIKSLFPGIEEEWTAAGGVLGDFGEQCAFYAGTKRFVSERAGEDAICLSRSVLEGVLRRRVLALPKVLAATGVTVEEPILDRAAGRVCGVTWQARDERHARTRELRADLVVDASGRGSRQVPWLARAGFDTPTKEQVRVDIHYATAYLQRDAHHVPGLEVVLCAPTPQHPMPGVLLAQEGGRWVATLGGYGADVPPLDRQAFIERARRMAPELAAVVGSARFLCEPFAYAFPSSQRWRFERVKNLPRGLLAFGDSICSFNPIFGQGMSVAACEALALAGALQSGDRDLPARFYRAAARSIDIAWQTAVGADLAIPSVEGARPVPVRLINAYIARVFDAAQFDGQVALAFERVAHLLAAPPTLMHPAMMARVFTARWRHRGGNFAIASMPTSTSA